MCFDLDSQPPVEPVFAAAVRPEELALTAMDGTRFAAFAAHVETLTRPDAGIVILPDVRGLYSFYRELAQRFAERGIEAVVIDYFGRTAGLEPRGDDFDFMAHVQQTEAQTLNMDIAAAVAYLRSMPGGGPRAIFTVGFCFGGSLSFQQAANNLGLAGVIGFYGRPGPMRDGSPGPMRRVSQFACPVLGLFGGADQGIPVEQVKEFDQALAQAGVPHEIIIYPNAPHSFFDRKQQEFQQESNDAWQRVLQFVQKYTPAETV